MNTSQICSPRPSDAATLPEEIQSRFEQYYSYILSITYVILYENKLTNLHTEPENVTTLTDKMQNFFI